MAREPGSDATARADRDAPASREPALGGRDTQPLPSERTTERPASEDSATPQHVEHDDSRYSTTLVGREVDPGDTAVESPVLDGEWGPGRTGTTQLIAPQSGQVNPPVGVLRAAAQGAFDISRRPIPEPKQPPRYAGDLTLEELARYGNIGSSPAALGITDASFDDQRPTLEIELPPALFAMREEASAATSHSDTLPGPALTTGDDGSDRVTPPETEDEFEPIGVKVSKPVQESGIWRPDAKDGNRDGSTPPRSFGMVAAILVLVAAAAATYMLMSNGSTTPGKPGKGEVVENGGAEGPLPASASVDERLASAVRLLERGRRADAHQELDTVLAKHPSNTRALVLRSNLLVEEHKLDDALKAAQASVAADPKFADGHLALAVVHQERGDTQKAVAAYQRFLELAPASELAPAVQRRLRTLEGGAGGTPP